MVKPSFSFDRPKRVPIGKFFTLCLTSIALLMLDQKFEAVQHVRSIAASFTFPLQWIAAKPVELYEHISLLARSQTELKSQNQALQTENIKLQAASHKNQALEKELNELKNVLHLKQLNFTDSVAAEVVSNGSNPFSDLLVIDKGSESGIRVGDAVIDRNGLVGQITQARRYSADLRLISANELIVPVAVARTGVRSLTFGNGNHVSLRYFPTDADLQVGDVLLTSGIDSVYPGGIPVARVKEASKASGTPYYQTKLETSSALQSSKYLLVLSQKPTSAAASSAVTDQP
ncbi:rod shape-determining protein MreC [Neisseria canis]|uniref:Cell shape-determining protein MreC n=1 Tax=Neisseria canis TaxID=493 RepID=A0A1X3CQN6_9NEIS|nr:rod shape-determining protein MreC [Neisseria canis]OSI09681.1 rod shape-determining protein MreC [Neisseria canis]VEF01954.1 rod shape-determining protein MreC [Neisseria canis]